MRPIVLALTALWTAAPALLRADDEAALVAAVKKFGQDKAKLKADVLTQFDKISARLMRQPGLSAAAKQSLKAKWAGEKRAFAERDELSADSDLIELALVYGVKVSNAYAPISRRYEAMTAAAQKAGDDDAAVKLLARRAKYEASALPGAREFVNGSKWNGRRYAGKGSGVPAVLVVNKLEGSVGKSFYAQDMQFVNHPAFDIRFEIDGMRVKGGSIKARQGGLRAMEFAGVVVGKTLILDTVDSNGKRLGKGRLILTR